MADIELVEGEGKAQGHTQNPHSKSQRLYVSSQTILRILVILSTLGATWIMVTAKQSVEILGISLDARYSYSAAFKFFALANAIACGFSLLTLFLVCCISRRVLRNYNVANFMLFLIDLLMMALVVGGCSGASAIGYVGKYGNSHTGWLPICDHFGKFCHRVTTSVALSYLGVLCLLILTIISSLQLQRQRQRQPQPQSSLN